MAPRRPSPGPSRARSSGPSSGSAPGPSRGHSWAFLPRFRRGSFGWRSALAVTRIKEALAEIRKVSRADARLGADGAVLFLERVAPAIAQVDGSSGAIGTAVNRAIEQLVPIIVAAPVDEATRARWLDRLDAACEADEMPYLELLGDHWGDLCGSAEMASRWADRLLTGTRQTIAPERGTFGFYYGTSACLSALYRAGRFDELVALLDVPTLWAFRKWAARALLAQGRRAEALAYAKACRRPYDAGSDWGVDAFCAEVLQASGFAEEAYRHHALPAPRHATYVARFRALAKQFPDKAPAEILADLVATTPGAEGKWFAAAKQAGLYDEALALADRSPCDPRTLARAARDFRETRPAFALGAAVLGLRWIGLGYGYEITAADVRMLRAVVLEAAERCGRTAEVGGLIGVILAAEGPGASFLRQVLGRGPAD